jgi:hypothetical protein
MQYMDEVHPGRRPSNHTLWRDGGVTGGKAINTILSFSTIKKMA